MAGEKERLHWLPVHVNDLTSDEKVLAMTTQEFGAYFLLLCAAWKSEPACSIPQDDEVLARLARLSPREWAKAKARVLAPWKSNEDGRLYQKKLLEVHADVLAKIDQKKQAGRRGGQAKAANNTKQTSPEISSGARAVLEQRYSFASSEQGSETLAKSYQPLTINQSVSNETQPPTPYESEQPAKRRRNIAAPHPAVSGIDVNGEMFDFEDDPLRWQAEFVRRWNHLKGVARHESNALSTFNLSNLRSRLCESDWNWQQAFARFPLWLPGGIWQITLGKFLEPGTVSNILDGRYEQRTERPQQAGLFGNRESDPTRVRTGRTSETIRAAMAQAAAVRSEERQPGQGAPEHPCGDS